MRQDQLHPPSIPETLAFVPNHVLPLHPFRASNAFVYGASCPFLSESCFLRCFEPRPHYRGMPAKGGKACSLNAYILRLFSSKRRDGVTFYDHYLQDTTALVSRSASSAVGNEQVHDSNFLYGPYQTIPPSQQFTDSFPIQVMLVSASLSLRSVLRSLTTRCISSRRHHHHARITSHGQMISENDPAKRARRTLPHDTKGRQYIRDADLGCVGFAEATGDPTCAVFYVSIEETVHSTFRVSHNESSRGSQRHRLPPRCDTCFVTRNWICLLAAGYAGWRNHISTHWTPLMRRSLVQRFPLATRYHHDCPRALPVKIDSTVLSIMRLSALSDSRFVPADSSRTSFY